MKEIITQEQLSKMLIEAKTNNKIKEKIIKENMGLVNSQYYKYVRKERNNADDLKQIGLIALNYAIDTYKENNNMKFSTYAINCINFKIINYFRDTEKKFSKMSRKTIKLSKKLNDIKNEFCIKYGRQPSSIKELAKAFNYTEDEINEAQLLLKSINNLSLENDCYRYKRDSADTIKIKDCLESVDDNINQIILKTDISKAFEQLTPEESFILTQKYFKDKTQLEIGQTLGLSQITVSRRERQALSKLKVILKEEYLYD